MEEGNVGGGGGVRAGGDDARAFAAEAEPEALADGVYYTNYELWSPDIYGSARPRTAIGFFPR